MFLGFGFRNSFHRTPSLEVVPFLLTPVHPQYSVCLTFSNVLVAFHTEGFIKTEHEKKFVFHLSLRSEASVKIKIKDAPLLAM
jgi:hypothetical protein